MSVVAVAIGYDTPQFDALWAARPLIMLDANTALFLFVSQSDPPPGPTATSGVFTTKTTDRGASWSVSPVAIAALADLENCRAAGVWFDKWTPGQSGTKLHVVYTKTFATQGSFYRRAESTTQLPEGTAQLLSTPSTGVFIQHFPVKCLNGHLYNVSRSGGAQTIFVSKSVNNGDTWSAVFTNNSFPDGLAALGTTWWAIVPSPTIAAGFWLFVQTFAGSIHHYEWNGSAFNTVALIDTGLTSTQDYQGLSATIRHSDGAVFLAYHTDVQGDPNVIRVTRVTSLGTWQIRGTVVTASFGGEQLRGPQIMCVQGTGELIVGYALGTSVPHYRRSQSSGLLWSAELTLETTLANDGASFAPISTPGLAEGFFDQVWWSTAGAGYDSATGSFPLGGYRVRSTADGGPAQGPAACQLGNPLQGAGDILPFIGGPYPNYLSTAIDGLVLAYASVVGTFTAGDAVVGVSSRATGWFLGYLASGRTLISTPRAGPGPDGTPFLPGETVQKVGDASKRFVLHGTLGVGQYVGEPISDVAI